MVHLIENYYAIPNNMGFTLAVDKGKTDKEGNKTYDTIGYCGSFEETISLLRRKVVDQRLQNGSYELSEALEILQVTAEDIKAVMERKGGHYDI